ncbi:hypothetical protein FOA52_016076 [Chlamydomonas sp. UWO 241]|nr:hypothetical protein FOA52_016076 [Chlamydomonas sp. UWO 241]
MARLTLALLFGCLLLVAAPVARAEDGGDAPDDPDTVVLTLSNFDEVIGSSKYALVEFYAPWCGHCKSLAPHYAKAATALKSSHPDVVVAKLDADAHKELGSRFGVSGFPTLKWFVDGEVAMDYGGGRDADGIISWIKKKIGPVAATVESAETLTALEADNEVLVLAYYKALEGDAYSAFAAVAAKTEDVGFAQTTDAAVAAAAGLTSEGVVVIKTFKGEERETAVAAAAASLSEFITAEKMPLTIEFTSGNTNKIFQSGIPKQIIYWAGPDDHKPESVGLKVLRAVAASYKGKLVFVTSSIEGDGEPITKFFGLSGTAPVVLGFHMEANKKYRMAGALTVEALTAFVDSLLDGTAQPDFKMNVNDIEKLDFGNGYKWTKTLELYLTAASLFPSVKGGGAAYAAAIASSKHGRRGGKEEDADTKDSMNEVASALERSDAAARILIRQTLSSEVLSMMPSHAEGSAPSMWKWCKSVGLYCNAAKAEDFARQVMELKQALDETVLTYSARAFSLTEQLNNTGKPIPEYMLVTAYKRGLRDEYEGVLTAVNAREVAPCMQDLMTMLCAHDSMLLAKSSRSQPMAMAVVHGKPGRPPIWERSSGGGQGSRSPGGGGSGSGSWRGSGGGDGGSWRGGGDGGRPKERVCFRCHQPGHLAAECRAPAPVPRPQAAEAPAGSGKESPEGIFFALMASGGASAEIPASPLEDGVTVVVGKSFEDIVLDAAKDVLLEVYAPWCGHCKTLAPIYAKLAKRFKSVDSVVIAKMDGTENEHDKVEAKGYPTLLFYPAGSKDKQPIVVDGERSLAALTKFIKAHAVNKYELPKKSKAAESEDGKDEL